MNEPEITSAMIEAGLDALWSEDLEDTGGRAAVIRIFRAMMAAHDRPRFKNNVFDQRGGYRSPDAV